VAGPLQLDDRDAHGLIPGAEDGRSDRVTYGFTGEGEAMSLQVKGFDLIDDEVRVLLNGQLVAVLASTPEGTWGPPQAILLPDLRVGENRLTFDSLPNPYRQDPWGVRLTDAAPAALV
jgi:hypothetical protein